ncbi:thiopeptide-type bacteriocin biosynthesis protein [Micromonospora globbae]|uniref:thiopeptide-type bacteriocin biosynthesis protein n=1 Tax=Micromonospora globbae TaxID=1894969 RepID=UPI00343F565A
MDPSPLETGALAILNGADAATVATALALPAADLVSAVRTYQAAGRAALAYAARSSRWRHVTLVISGRDEAEHVGINYLAPAMERLRGSGALTGWWYLRKSGEWRIRYLPTPERDEAAAAGLARTLDGLRDDGIITNWISGIYEPEAEVFGGPAAMDIAHTLFSSDSRCLLQYLARPEPLGRRELLVLLPTVLVRAAGLDWYEQGQLWAEVAHGRTGTIDPARITALTPAVRTLLRADVSAADPRTLGIAESVTAYAQAGAALRHLATHGRLHRGLRDVCARHVIFAANRLGVSYEHQSQLIQTAREVILGPARTPQRPVCAETTPVDSTHPGCSV